MVELQVIFIFFMLLDIPDLLKQVYITFYNQKAII